MMLAFAMCFTLFLAEQALIVKPLVEHVTVTDDGPPSICEQPALAPSRNP